MQAAVVPEEARSVAEATVFDDSETLISCRRLDLGHRTLDVVEVGDDLGFLLIRSSASSSLNLPPQCLVNCQPKVTEELEDKLKSLG